ncbi:hypothetical protein CRX72_12430 [Pantoea sp. BRM17]|nr:hypothetical protein CRX72_12430 [Pantoea sp. BRM17]
MIFFRLVLGVAVGGASATVPVYIAEMAPANKRGQRTEPFVKVIAAVATLGGLLFGYDTGVISGALLFMGDDIHLTPLTTGLVTSSLLFGAAFGALISGHFGFTLSLCDRYLISWHQL